ncbi:MAG: hypothetical protein JO263_03595 [Candidatus Eremiobacteraeota bacterium]|nr:hypothetical protein [Candidatus Eremiobacteraeota bacterium]
MRQTVLAIGCSAFLAGCGNVTQPPVATMAHEASDIHAAARGRGTWKLVTLPGYPHGIVRAKNGDYWVADGDQTDTLSRVTPGGKVTTYSIGYTPYEIAIDGGGNFWLTNATFTSKLIKVTPKLNVTAYQLGDATCGGVILGGDGNVWFAENTHIGKMTPGGKLTEYPVQGANVYAGTGLAWSRGLLWFQSETALASLDPVSGDVKFYNYRAFNTGPIAAARDGTLWFTTFPGSAPVLVGFNPKKSAFATYTAPASYGPGDGPAGMILSNDGRALWYSARHVVKQNVYGGAVRFDFASKRFTAYAAPAGYDWDWDIIETPRGNIWTTGGGVQILDPGK